MRWIGIGLVAFCFAGCAPSHISIRPQTTDVLLSKDALAAYVRVPETGSGGLDVRVSSPGVFRHEHKSESSIALSIDIEVENRSESVTAGFDPNSIVLSGGLRRELHPVAPATSNSTAQASGGSDTTTVAIAPGERRAFHVDFKTRATGDPRELAPFSLQMTFDYGKREHPVTVSFVRHEEVRYYGYPSYYYGYPYGYGYPYYDGPYGRHGWGPGFYGGAAWGW